MFLLNFLKKYKVVLLISLFLFIIPFFWLKSGEIDIGGDSNRLYFYDPLSSLISYGIYSIYPIGISKLAHNQYFIPFLLFISFLQFIFNSPTVIINIFNGFSLFGSFIFVFLIIKELLQKENGKNLSLNIYTASIIGALFYTLSPSVVDNMTLALTTHSQVFLNPMIFYFLLRYLKTYSLRYAWITILFTLIFSTNFTLTVPPLFAFYILAIIFLLIYNFLILKKSMPWKQISIIIVLFLGLHAYHIFPTLSNVFDKGSQFNTRVFESNSGINQGLEYFNSSLSQGKISSHIFLPLADNKINWSLIIIPILIMLGFILIKKKDMTLLLVSTFFLITLFLVSANVTQTGVEFYRKLFFIPGFGMFRNFYGQWQWVYSFFYALLAGISISYLFFNMRKKYIYIISIVAVGFILARSLSFFSGDIINVSQRGSNNLKAVIVMDKNYEQLISYVKKIPNDGRILHMPFTDFGYNIVGGQNNGVYIGLSILSILAGRNDFPGYQIIDPFSEVFANLSKEKNYPLIRQMMSLLQIRYVLYNSDEIISEKFFPGFPYGYTGTPTSQPGLKDFVYNISKKKVYEIGTYALFEVEKSQYLPKFYAASDIFFYDINPKYNKEYSHALSFFPKKPLDDGIGSRIAFVDRVTCNTIISKQICSQNNFNSNIIGMQILYQQINPTKYKLIIKNVTKPFFLVFQNNFNNYWKLYESDFSFKSEKIADSYYNGEIVEFYPKNNIIDSNPFETNSLRLIYDNTHIKVNGYANAWYINPSLKEKTDTYEFIVEMIGQKTFYMYFIISLMFFVVFIFIGIKIFIFDTLSHIIYNKRYGK